MVEEESSLQAQIPEASGSATPLGHQHRISSSLEPRETQAAVVNSTGTYNGTSGGIDDQSMDKSPTSIPIKLQSIKLDQDEEVTRNVTDIQAEVNETRLNVIEMRRMMLENLESIIRNNASRMRTEERLLQGYTVSSSDDRISGELTTGPSRRPGFVQASQGSQTITPTKTEPMREDDFEEWIIPESKKSKKKKQKASLPASNTPTVISQVIYDMNVELGQTSEHIPNTVDIIVVYMYNNKIPTSETSPFAHGAKQWDEGGRISGADSKNNGSRLSPENLQPIPKETASRPTLQTRNSSKGKNPQSDFKSAKAPPLLQATSLKLFSDKDMFPCVNPQSRIVGHGFDLGTWDRTIDLDAATSELRKSILEGPDKISCSPTVFVGYGYGCVLVQKFLSNLSKVPESGDSQIADFIAAVILFEPPLLGWANPLIQWTTGSLRVESKLFIGLGNGSPELETIWNSFSNRF